MGSNSSLHIKDQLLVAVIIGGQDSLVLALSLKIVAYFWPSYLLLLINMATCIFNRANSVNHNSCHGVFLEEIFFTAERILTWLDYFIQSQDDTYLE